MYIVTVKTCHISIRILSPASPLPLPFWIHNLSTLLLDITTIVIVHVHNFMNDDFVWSLLTWNLILNEKEMPLWTCQKIISLPRLQMEVCQTNELWTFGGWSFRGWRWEKPLLGGMKLKIAETSVQSRLFSPSAVDCLTCIAKQPMIFHVSHL